eukprot:PhM_4_TR15979/c0_g1_i2/m.97928
MHATSKNVVHPDSHATTGISGNRRDVRRINVFGKKFPTYFYTDLLTRYPTVFLVISALLPLILTILSLEAFTRTTDYDMNISGFEIRFHDVARAKAAVEAASDEWQRRLAEGDALFGISNFANSSSLLANLTLLQEFSSKRSRRELRKRMYLQYRIPAANRSAAEANIMTSIHINDIADFETKVQNLMTFRRMCWTNPFKEGDTNVEDAYATTPQCVPLGSLMTYFYPGLIQTYPNGDNWEFSGIVINSTYQGTTKEMITTLYENPHILWFLTAGATQSPFHSSHLRTQVGLGWPVLTASGMWDEETYDDQHTAFVDELVDLIERLQRRYSFEISLGGDGVFEALTEAALRRSGYIGVFSFVFVLAMFWVYMHSFVLAALGVLQAVMTYFSSEYLHLLTNGDDKLSLLSSLNLFISLAIACDGVMVFFNIFKHSGIMPTTGKQNLITVAQRVAFTFRKAGTGIIVSNIVSMCAFSSNYFSLIPAVRTFSAHMMWILLMNMYMFMTFFPAAILFHHYHFSGRRRNRQRQREVLIRTGLWQRDEKLQSFLDDLDQYRTNAGLPSYQMYSEDMAERFRFEMDERSKRFGSLLRVPPWKLRLTSFWKSKDVTDVPLEAVPEPTLADFPDASDVVGHSGVHRRRPAQNAIVHIPPQWAYRNTMSIAELNLVANTPLFQNAYPTEQPSALGMQPQQQQQPDAANSNNQNAEENIADGATPDAPTPVESGPVFDVNAGNSTAPGQQFTAFGSGSVGMAPLSTGLAPVVVKNLTSSDVSAHEARYTNIASFMGISLVRDGRELDGSPTPALLRLPWVAESIVLSLSGALHVVEKATSHVTTESTTRESGGMNAIRFDDTMTAPGVREPTTLWKRIRMWWKKRGEVKRRWCFGRFGKRVGESQEEKDRRILGKKVKHEGYSVMERLMNNVFSMVIFRGRFVLIALYTALVIWWATEASDLKGTAENPRFFETDLYEKYLEAEPEFGMTGSCDYCSAYYRPRSSFPPVSRSTVETCRAAGFNVLIHATVDKCGVCFGSNECVDCGGTVGGTRKLDTCGQCLQVTDPRWDQCLSCDYNPEREDCWWCARYQSKMNYGGKNCAKKCDDTNCDPKRGKCNSWTGKCECLASYTEGFYADDPSTPNQHCSKCLDGFFPLPGVDDDSRTPCTLECSDNHKTMPTCLCEPSVGMCTACGALKVGFECQNQWVTMCRNGIVNSTNQCQCNAGWDGSKCDTYKQCASHGVVYPSSDVPIGGCKCNGQWRGLQCDMCRCLNGGTCDDDGTCKCFGAWGGNDCSVCNSNCQSHGRCPIPWSADQYPEKPCNAIFCPVYAELGTVCEMCKRNATTFTPIVYNNNTECWECKGVWSGSMCNKCNIPEARGVSCNDDGFVVGCDGIMVTSPPYKAIDACGVCGGSGVCVGCDGIAGSTKKVDDCGVCGGYNECAAQNGERGVQVTTSVNVVFGIQTGDTFGTYVADPSFDISDVRLQRHLLWMCEYYPMLDNQVKAAQSDCLWTDFSSWVQGETARFGVYATFPVPPPVQNSSTTTPTVHAILLTYAREKGRMGQIGFTSDGDSSTAAATKVEWVKHTFKTPLRVASTEAAILGQHAYWTKEQMPLLRFEVDGVRVVPVVYSEQWLKTLTEKYALLGLKYSIAVSSIVCFSIVLILTCSFTVTLLCCLAILGAIAATLGTMQVNGWEIGAVEQIVVSLLFGFASEYVVHLVEGYLEFLHATQSHIFAVKVNRKEAFRGMILRTGAPILLSSLTVMISSCILFGANIPLYHTVARVVIMVTGFSVLFALVFLGAFLCAVGPTTSYRHWVLMLLMFVLVVTVLGLVLLIIFVAGGIEAADGSTFP